MVISAQRARRLFFVYYSLFLLATFLCSLGAALGMVYVGSARSASVSFVRDMRWRTGRVP